MAIFSKNPKMDFENFKIRKISEKFPKFYNFSKIGEPGSEKSSFSKIGEPEFPNLDSKMRIIFREIKPVYYILYGPYNRKF